MNVRPLEEPASLKAYMKETVRNAVFDIHTACQGTNQKAEDIFKQIYGEQEPICQNPALTRQVTQIRHLFKNPDAASERKVEDISRFQQDMIEFTNDVLATLNYTKTTSQSDKYNVTENSVIKEKDFTLSSTLVRGLASSKNGSIKVDKCKITTVNAYRDATLIDSIVDQTTTTYGEVKAIGCTLEVIEAYHDATLTNCTVKTKVSSQYDTIKANNSNLKRVKAYRDAKITNCTGEAEISSEFDTVTAINSNIKRVNAYREARLENCTGDTEVFSQHETVTAISSSLNKVSAYRDVVIDNCTGEAEVSSQSGMVTATNSILKQVEADRDVSIMNCSAKRVVSRMGSVLWNKSSSDEQIVSIQAEKDAGLTDLTVKTVRASGEGVLTNSTVESIEAGKLDVKNSFIDNAVSKGDIQLHSTFISNLTLFITEGKESVIDCKGDNNIGPILIKPQSISSSASITMVGVTSSHNHTHFRIGKVTATGNSRMSFGPVFSNDSSPAQSSSSSSGKVSLSRGELDKRVRDGLKPNVRLSEGVDVDLIHLEGGTFSIKNGKVSVIKLPPNWEIKDPQESEAEKNTALTKVTLRVKGGVIEGDITFEGCEGTVIFENNALHNGRIVRGSRK